MKSPLTSLGQLRVHPLSVLLLFSSFGIWTANHQLEPKKSGTFKFRNISNDSSIQCETYLFGYIKDDNQNAMLFQKIYLIDDSSNNIIDSTNSGSNGDYIFCFKSPGKIRIQTSRPYYEPFEFQLEIIQGQNLFNIEMKNKIVSSRGVSSNGTAYFIDGIRVSGCYASSSRGLMTSNNSEEYKVFNEGKFIKTSSKKVATFSSDVDNASYTNVRRMINHQSLPIPDAVRVEEFVNYFDYSYSEPAQGENVSINLEAASCPWNSEHQLVKIGLKAKSIEKTEMGPNNLVFLIDVSGSMSTENKLPLVKSSLKTLLKNLDSNDKISIVTYSGSTRLVLESTMCSQNSKIIEIIDQLEAGGSTAGGRGIEMAYREAENHFIKEGNNRVILCTDGDFNVGITRENDLLKLIKNKRNAGVYLTVCGFGYGNLKDSKLELLADNGNGNYFYIDNQKEAERIFDQGMSATLFTMAKDVKIQVEFNPRYVKAYRLIGYENRQLENKDFENDNKDAGEMGAGQTVTALYEIVPWGVEMKDENDPQSRRSDHQFVLTDSTDEIMTVKVRYKAPGASQSTEISQSIASKNNSYVDASPDFKLACGVALFGMLLRESKYIDNASYGMVMDLIRENDSEEVKELLTLVQWVKSKKE